MQIVVDRDVVDRDVVNRDVVDINQPDRASRLANGHVRSSTPGLV